MKQPLVSVVIPTYNRNKMVVRLVDSIFASTYKNIEIIVVDDASIDNTETVLKERFKKNKKNQSNKKYYKSFYCWFKKCWF